MLGFAWSEIILIGAVALVVIGPKDLPRVMRTLGQWSRKLRALAGDFQRQFDNMVREAELDDIKRQAEQAMNVDDIKKDVETAVDVAGMKKSMDEVTAAAELPVVPPSEAPVMRPAEVPPMPPAESNAAAETIHDPAPHPAPAEPPAATPAPDAAREPAP